MTTGIYSRRSRRFCLYAATAACCPALPDRMLPAAYAICLFALLMRGDGRVLAGNLRATGNDEVWLRRALAAQNAGRLEDVFLATVNAQNQLAVFARTGRQVKRELFE